jgi:heme exporter protein CcmD
MAAFFAMGGYGGFVWPAYGASALVLIIAIAVSVQAHMQAREAVRRLEEEIGDSRR